MYEKRIYRNKIDRGLKKAFRVIVKETDLHIQADTNLEKITRDLILKYRGHIEAYIKRNPVFAKTLEPLFIRDIAPLIVQDMAEAGIRAKVGPMAAVAGAVAQYVGGDLLAHTDEVIVENGGDIFIKTKKKLTIAIYAGNSPLSLKAGIVVDSCEKPVAVCTSSGTIGHSLSMGKADAVTVISDSCPLADAAATAIGNLVKKTSDIQAALESGQNIDGVKGVVIIMGDKLGAWGDIELGAVR